MSNLKPDGMNRRQFLGTTGLAVAMFNIGPSTRAWGAEAMISAVFFTAPVGVSPTELLFRISWIYSGTSARKF
jgi:hypothetical protein